jgi:hypothetical protein
MLWGCSLEEADVLGSGFVGGMPEARLIVATEDVVGDARPGASSGMSVVVASLLTISGRNDIESIVELSLGPRFDELKGEGSPADAVIGPPSLGLALRRDVGLSTLVLKIDVEFR